MTFPYEFVFTRIASTEGFVIAAGLITAYLIARHGLKHSTLFLALAGALLASIEFLKALFRVPRMPGGLVEASGYALPSGHAAGALFVALTVCHLARKLHAPLRYAVWALSLGFALAIGISRVVYRVHTPFQVLAGFAVGAFFAWLYVRLDARASRRK